jgi:hypothetical protein
MSTTQGGYKQPVKKIGGGISSVKNQGAPPQLKFKADSRSPPKFFGVGAVNKSKNGLNMT